MYGYAVVGGQLGDAMRLRGPDGRFVSAENVYAASERVERQADYWTKEAERAGRYLERATRPETVAKWADALERAAEKADRYAARAEEYASVVQDVYDVKFGIHYTPDDWSDDFGWDFDEEAWWEVEIAIDYEG